MVTKNMSLLLSSAKELFLFVLTALLVFIQRKKKVIKTDILLIRTDALGDFMVSLPLMKQIHDFAETNNRKVTVIVAEPQKELAEKSGFFDVVISIPPRIKMKSFFERIRLFRAMREVQADTVVNLLFFGRCAIEDYIAFFVQAPRKLVMENNGSYPLFPRTRPFRMVTGFIYNEKMIYKQQISLVENEAILASCAMHAKIRPELGNLDFLRPFSEPHCTSPYYLVIPGSADKKQRWDSEKLARVIDAIDEFSPEIIPVVTGVESDQDSVIRLLEKVKNKEKVVDLCGKTTLMQLIGNVSAAAFVLCNDTGTLHISAKLGKQTFCVLGLGHWGAYNPNPFYKTVTYFSGSCDTPCCSWMCRKESTTPYPCIKSVSAEPVISAIRSFLCRTGGNND